MGIQDRRFQGELGRDGWEIINLGFRELGNRFDFTGVARRQIAE